MIATPTEVNALTRSGCDVLVSSGAGSKAGFDDEAYASAGARIAPDNETVWAECDFVAKVKEIEPSEYPFLREGQIIYTCIHPAAHPEEVDALLDNKVIAFTAEDSHRYGSPNCEAAGKAGAFMGLWSMMSFNGGSGKFASGLAGAPVVNAVVCGCGIVGKAAIEVLVNMGCHVTAVDVSVGILREISSKYQGRISTLFSNRYNLEQILPETDLLVNCVRWPKNASDYMITREMVASMRRGSVITDISNDYGCIETFHETTHDDPTYIEEGVVHYCVSNIPGAIAGATSVSYAAAVLPHFLNIIENGVVGACARDGYLRRSLTTYRGYLTHEETSGIQNRPWIPPEKILGIEDQPLDPAPKTTVTKSDFYYTDIIL